MAVIVPYSVCSNIDLQSQKTLKASYDAAVGQMDELLAQLKSEKQKNLELADQLQLSNVAIIRAEQVNMWLLRIVGGASNPSIQIRSLHG